MYRARAGDSDEQVVPRPGAIHRAPTGLFLLELCLLHPCIKCVRNGNILLLI